MVSNTSMDSYSLINKYIIKYIKNLNQVLFDVELTRATRSSIKNKSYYYNIDGISYSYRSINGSL